MEKVPKEYIKSFNLGYEIAKELNLSSSMFSDSNQNSNPIQAGMNQFIIEQSNIKRHSHKNEQAAQERVKGKNNGKGLIL
jgi:hypothetical protein